MRATFTSFVAAPHHSNPTAHLPHPTTPHTAHQALTSQNGEALANSILDMSERHTCSAPDAFVAALRDMFARIDPERIRTATGEVLQDMIEELRRHEVGDACFRAVMCCVCRGTPGDVCCVALFLAASSMS